MTSRPGELRHEEFSHCCIHESLLETKLFSSLYADKTLAKKNLDEPCFIIFPGQSLKCVWQKGRTNKECKRKGEKLFEHVIFVFVCFVSSFVGDEMEVKEPQNVTNYTVPFKCPK